MVLCDHGLRETASVSQKMIGKATFGEHPKLQSLQTRFPSRSFFFKLFMISYHHLNFCPHNHKVSGLLIEAARHANNLTIIDTEHSSAQRLHQRAAFVRSSAVITMEKYF